jgi:hypothetical protein
MLGGEGFLTLAIKMRVRPEPKCEEELAATSLSRAHALLYRELSYGLLQRSAFNSQVLARQSE